MAGSKRPSFLKRQKEQTRLARAAEKREARRARKHAKASGLVPAEDGDDLLMPPGEGDDLAAGEEPAGEDA